MWLLTSKASKVTQVVLPKLIPVSVPKLPPPRLKASLPKPSNAKLSDPPKLSNKAPPKSRGHSEAPRNVTVCQKRYYSTLPEGFHAQKSPMRPMGLMVAFSVCAAVLLYGMSGKEAPKPDATPSKADALGIAAKAGIAATAVQVDGPQGAPGPEDLGKVKSAAREIFDAQIDRECEGLSETDKATVKGKAEQLWKKLDRQVFHPAEQQSDMTSEQMSTLIQQANHRIEAAVRQIGMRIQELNVDQRPTLVQRPDGTITVIMPAPPIETIVAQGGGVRGVGTGPALVEMADTGMLDHVQHMVGASAGALMATCIASGMSADDFREFSDNVPLLSIIKGVNGLKALYPNIEFGWVGFSGARVIELADQASGRNAAECLQQVASNPALKARWEKLPEGERQQLERLRDPDFGSDRSGKMVTFSDLEILNKLDPARFKGLALTVYDSTHQQKMIVDKDSAPQVPIAFAARMSMSIPVFFKSVTFDFGKGPVKLVDGGVGSNAPTEVVLGGKTGRDRELASAKTVVLTFDNANLAFDTMFGTNPTSRQRPDGALVRLQQVLIGVVTTNPNYSESDLADRQKIHDAGPAALVVYHGDLGMTDFWANDMRVNFARQQASEKMLDQLEMRTNQAISLSCKDLDEVVASLPKSSLDAIRKGGPPDARTFPKGLQDEQFVLQFQLYQKVKDLV